MRRSAWKAWLALSLVTLASCPTPSSIKTVTPLAFPPSPDTVAPGTGLVLWADNPVLDQPDYQNAVSLEFATFTMADLMPQADTSSWTKLEAALELAKSRGHQLIARVRLESPGEDFGVPSWLTTEVGYTRRTLGVNNGGEILNVEVPDWGNEHLKTAYRALLLALGQRYDGDPRLFELQLGFGFWSEYHQNLDRDRAVEGVTFPEAAYQKSVLRAVDKALSKTHWGISIDAAQPLGPFDEFPGLLSDDSGLDFGTFDDSFLGSAFVSTNLPALALLGDSRWRSAPRGGEFAYESKVQRLALSPQGVNGMTWPEQAAQTHLSYILANDQPSRHTAVELKKAGQAAGYHLLMVQAYHVTYTSRTTPAFAGNRIVLRNDGVAPFYGDLAATIDGANYPFFPSGPLLPGEEARATVAPISEPADLTTFRLTSPQFPYQDLPFTVTDQPLGPRASATGQR